MKSGMIKTVPKFIVICSFDECVLEVPECHRLYSTCKNKRSRQVSGMLQILSWLQSLHS